MALGTFEPDAQEGPRRAGGEVLGLGILGDVVGQGRRLGARIVGVARPASRAAETDGEDFPDDLVVAHFLGDFLAEPRLEGRRQATDLAVRVGLGQEQHAIGFGGVGQIRGAVEQDLHQLRALVRARIVEEVARLGGRRDLADQVEVDAAQVLGVIGGRGGPNLGLGPLGGQQAVDLLGERLRIDGRRAAWPLGLGRRLVRPECQGGQPSQHEAHRPDPEPMVVLHLGLPRAFPSTLRGQRQGRLGSRHVPEFDRSVAAAGGQASPVRREGNPLHDGTVADQADDLGAGRRVVERHQPVVHGPTRPASGRRARRPVPGRSGTGRPA